MSYHFYNSIKTLPANFDHRITNDLMEELGAAIFTIGKLQACFADAASCAVDKMYEELTKLQTT